MNPPFPQSLDFVRTYVKNKGAEIVAALLPSTFLETPARAEFFAKHPPSEVFVIINRPSFDGTGANSVGYRWVVWRQGARGTRVHWLADTSKATRGVEKERFRAVYAQRAKEAGLCA